MNNRGFISNNSSMALLRAGDIILYVHGWSDSFQQLCDTKAGNWAVLCDILFNLIFTSPSD